MTRQQILQQLQSMTDAGYKEFNDRIANCNTAPSLGIRIPALRQLAKEAARDDPASFLDELEGTPELYQEEHTLWGMVIGLAKFDDAERERRLDRWVPGILSWADCDCGNSTLKFMSKDPDRWFAYCAKWLESSREFELRFAIVTLMQYFIREPYIDRLLDIFSADHGDAYYVRMAQAWALSVCFVKVRDKTLTRFQARTMDPWVQNKAIQKCRESYRVSPEDKELLKTLKF